MKLPAKAIYACRAVTELALRYDKKEPVQIQAIATAQKIPKKFLVQILIRLKNSGLVNSSRGIAGGYNLAKTPMKLTVADVIRAIDDNIMDFDSGQQSSGHTEADRIFNVLWKDLNSDIVKRLESITFDSIVSQMKNAPLTYNI